MKNQIKVVAGIPLKDLPTKADMIYFLDGFYHRYGTAETVKAYRGLTKAQLAVVFLRARKYVEEHREQPPSSSAIERLRVQGLASYRIATKHHREYVQLKAAGNFEAAKIAFNNYKTFYEQFKRQLDRVAALAKKEREQRAELAALLTKTTENGHSACEEVAHD